MTGAPLALPAGALVGLVHPLLLSEDQQLGAEVDFDPSEASTRPVDSRSRVMVSELLRDLDAIVARR